MLATTKMREWHMLGGVPQEALAGGGEGHACASCNDTHARNTPYKTVALDHRVAFPTYVFHAETLHVPKPDHVVHKLVGCMCWRYSMI